ncbi:AAA family ATPase [Saccharobesus litoralis]|uniref:AAA family ATPase n=1 Tax=Saccharobesus litoralis TaxID=2172099 RepID=A0A2S0VX95_9ALTE|nr:AAA family ATPase [Saccharobesus litoralis]AWB68818.1 AAA family ATPase [Saccharobesus litoralis]
MYLYHFGLKELPFTLTPNTQFFLGLPSHHEALQVLLTALKTGEGFIKVTGEVGTGKTLLCRKLMAELPDGFVTAYIPNPNLQPQELTIAVAEELGVELGEGISQQKITQLIQDKVMAYSQQGKAVVLLLDESQALPEDSIEALRLFTNLETESRKLLQVVLFGQPELDERLAKPSLRQVKQRITFSYQLRVLHQNEVQPYINHRLAIAGYSGMPVFDEKASKRIFSASGGIPRIINTLAHKCLMLCYGQNQQSVSVNHVKQAVADTEYVQLPIWQQKKMLLAASGVVLLGLLGVAVGANLL